MTGALHTIEDAYRAFGAGDAPRLMELLAEAEWEEAAGMPYGGNYKGAQAVFENVFGPIAQDVQGFSARPDELLAVGDDRVLALGHYRGAAAAGEVDVPFAHLWTVADGRVTRFVQYTDTAKFRTALGR